MIESVSQIDSKKTACCHFMRPTGSRLVPSTLAAGANSKIAIVRFFCENELCNSNGLFIPPTFLFFYPISLSSQKRLVLVNYSCFNYLTFRRYV